MDPIQFMIKHRDAVINAYEIGGGPKKAWDILCSETPEMLEVMKYNSFKQYSTPFVKICNVVHEATKQTTEELTRENEMLKEENRRLKSENKNAQKVAQQKIEVIEHEKASLIKEIEKIKSKVKRYDKVVQINNEKIDVQKNQKTTKKSSLRKIIGWSIVKRVPKNPNHSTVYCAQRKIKGKVYTAYIGADLDADKAEQKIRSKERDLKKQGIKLSSLQKTR